ncbi:MAG TPA: DUF2254 family protein, partial [Mycobacterium sp.]|nr:DUF2254 family protein [Mycobacterium sp.]
MRKTGYLFQGTPSGARSYLDSIVTAMVSLTGMVFSLAFVAVQLSSGQYSPRVLQIYMRDRIIQFTFGTFVGTFSYALVVGQMVKPGAAVPRFAVSVAVLLVFASAALFILYVGRVAYMMRASTIIAEIADQSCKVMELKYPTDPTPPNKADRLPASEQVIPASRSGVLVTVHEPGLAKEAAHAACVLVLEHRVGDFVPEGAPLFTVHGEPEDIDHLVARAYKQVVISTGRTMDHDLAFGFRQL